MNNFSSFVVSLSRFFCGHKKTYIFSAPVAYYSSHPLLAAATPDNSSKVANSPRYFSITHILVWGALPEIFSAIVERVTVFMVSILPEIAIQNYLVRWPPLLKATHRAACRCVKLLRVESFLGKPIPFGEPSVIRSINYGSLALRKGNEAVRFVQRLHNFVSSHTGFHWSTSNGLVMQPLF